jgi:glutaconate CoA-transferase subunit A
MDADIASAAATVILSAEEIVPTEEIRRTADLTVIPYFCVDAVVEAPFGSYPSECYGLYDAGIKHIDAYARRVKADRDEGVRAYLEEYVHGPDTFDEYLDRIGRDQLEESRRKAAELVA